MSDSLLNSLAASLLAGEPGIEQVVARASHALGREWRWIPPLARRYVLTFAGQTRPRHRDIVRFLRRDAGLVRARAKYSSEISVEQLLTGPSQMLPVAAAAPWDVPAIVSVRELSDWLRLDVSELEWFSDLKGLGYRYKQPKLRHYRYWVLTKRSGDLRLIEAPKAHLKGLQKQILGRILERVPRIQPFTVS